MHLSPLHYYQAQQATLEQEIGRLSTQRNRVSWLRLFTLVAGTIILYQLRSLPMGTLVLLFVLLGTVFLWLVKQSLAITENLELANEKLRLAEEEKRIAAHQFLHRPDGLAFVPSKHPYAEDLDLFGKASLFQFLQRCPGEDGQSTLAQWLLEPADVTTILHRQQAAQNISGEIDWSIQFEAIGHQASFTSKNRLQILQWARESSFYYPGQTWNLLRLGWPALSLAALFLHISGFLSATIFYPLVLGLIAGSFWISKGILPIYRKLDKILPKLASLSGSFREIENASFQSSLLTERKSLLKTGPQTSASWAIRELRNILDRFDYRMNPLVFIPLNAFLLWDLQQVWNLEKWKKQHSEHLEKWLTVLAEMEALNSLGRLAFNYPNWTFPQLSETPGKWEAHDLGHPLIPADRCVTNSFHTSERPALALVTGSNMAGKSTFLRSIGINQVLAMAGAPVCARQLIANPMRIMSSMRIADNLEENSSTFYAELSKLKAILEEVNKGENVFLLLDEILRGTNSQDRQEGSRALIQQLIGKNAVALVATHDLALTNLEKQYPNQLTNYHFDVKVEEEELYFDYKLKEGICTHMNAALLMKKIGIDINHRE